MVKVGDGAGRVGKRGTAKSTSAGCKALFRCWRRALLFYSCARALHHDAVARAHASLLASPLRYDPAFAFVHRRILFAPSSTLHAASLLSSTSLSHSRTRSPLILLQPQTTPTPKHPHHSCAFPHAPLWPLFHPQPQRHTCTHPLRIHLASTASRSLHLPSRSCRLSCFAPRQTRPHGQTFCAYPRFHSILSCTCPETRFPRLIPLFRSPIGGFHRCWPLHSSVDRVVEPSRSTVPTLGTSTAAHILRSSFRTEPLRRLPDEL